MDVFAAMDRSYDYTATVVAGLRPEHATQPTNCPNFDVQALFGHLLGVLDMFTAGLTEQPYTPRAGDLLSGDIAGRYAEAVAANRAAWRALDSLDGTITLPFGSVPAAVSVNLNIIDVMVHGWDLAKATGGPTSMPEDVAETALAFTQGMLKPEMRSDAPDANFGPEVPVPASAPASERLVGFLGRRP
jgi:uncharacterized protein (TIGR03086 family)